MSALTRQQLDDFYVRLQALDTSLRDTLGNTAPGTEPVKLKDNQGRLSRMDELHNQSILKANRTVLEKRLRTVAAALVRVAEDAYGDCLECGEPIALPRLEAYPDASLCIGCASDAEQLPG